MRKKRFFIIALFSIATAALIASLVSADGSEGDPWDFLSGTARSFDPSTNTLTVRADDPRTNPNIYEYLVGVLSKEKGANTRRTVTIDWHGYYGATISYCYKNHDEQNCHRSGSFDMTVAYAGVDPSKKAIITSYTNNLRVNRESGHTPPTPYIIDGYGLLEYLARSNMYHLSGDDIIMSDEYRKTVDYRNIITLINDLAGGGTTYYDEHIGTGVVLYEDTIYDAYAEIGIGIKSVLYIPTSTANSRESFMQAAISSIQSYDSSLVLCETIDNSCAGSKGTYYDFYLGYGGEDSSIVDEYGSNRTRGEYYRLKIYGNIIDIAIVKDDKKSQLATSIWSQDAVSNLKIDIPSETSYARRYIDSVKHDYAGAETTANALGLNYYETHSFDIKNDYIDWLHDRVSDVSNLYIPLPNKIKDTSKLVVKKIAANSGLIENCDYYLSGNTIVIRPPLATGYWYIVGTTEPIDGGSTDPDDPAPVVIDVADGIYKIRSSANSAYVFDILGGSMSNGANAQIYADNGSPAQKFIIKKNSDSTYTIRSLRSGKVLDVVGGRTYNGVNVQQYEANGTCAQKWVFLKNSDGSLVIKSSCSDKVLDVAGGALRNYSNLQIYESNGTIAQKFSLQLISAIPEQQTVEDGVYKIVSSSNESLGLTVAYNSIYNTKNIQLGGSSQKEADFAIKHVGDGFYRISNINSLRVLDVSGGESFNGANVQQFDWNGNNAQLWVFNKNEDDSYSIMSKTNLLCLDAAGGNIRNDVNIQIYDCNKTIAQKFRLIKQ